LTIEIPAVQIRDSIKADPDTDHGFLMTTFLGIHNGELQQLLRVQFTAYGGNKYNFPAH
jgi:hypothetical protein